MFSRIKTLIRFETTWGWNEDRILTLFKIIYLFGWTTLFSQNQSRKTMKHFQKPLIFICLYSIPPFSTKKQPWFSAELCSPRPKLWVKAWSLMYISSSTHSIMDWAVIVPSVNVFRSCIMEYSRILSQNQLSAAFHQKQIEAERLHLCEYNVSPARPRLNASLARVLRAATIMTS